MALGRDGVPVVPLWFLFFGVKEFYIKDPKRYPQKGTTMETAGNSIN